MSSDSIMAGFMDELRAMPWKVRPRGSPISGRNQPYYEVVAEDVDSTYYVIPGMEAIGQSRLSTLVHIVEAHNFWLREGGDLR